MIRNFLILLLLSFHAMATPQKFPIDENGRWSLPLRYWYHQTTFESAGSYAFLAEVTKLGPEIPHPEKQESPLRFQSGNLKVIELLNPKPASSQELARVRELDVEGLGGLKVGDRVIVFIDPEPYEGGHVINFHEGGCQIGIRLPAADDLNFGAEPQQHVLKTIREGRTSLRQLSDEELSAWILVDSMGIARRFQRELDTEHLQWKETTK